MKPMNTANVDLLGIESPHQSRLRHRHPRRHHPHRHRGRTQVTCKIESNDPIDQQKKPRILWENPGLWVGG